MASSFVREFGDIRTIGNAVPLALTIIFAVSKKVEFTKDFFYVVCAFTLYTIISLLVTPTKGFLWTYSRWIIFFYVAFVIGKGYGYRFFVLAETILFHLAVISIVGWVLLLIVPVPFTNLISSISMPAFNEDERFASANVLIYTVIKSTVTEGSGDFYSIIRNSGFAWEPGAFSCFMCFAICFNAMREKGLRLKNNKVLILFLIALATTQSTTGYSTFALMVALWLIINKKYGTLILLIPIFIVVMNLPFMNEKILEKAEGYSDATLFNASSGESFDRLLSFRLLWDEFLLHPILGYGYSNPEFVQLDIKTWSGVGRLLAQYGIIMSLIFLFSLIKSSYKISTYYSSHCGFLIIIAMIGMMVSYMTWTHPFFIVIWLSCFFIKERRIISAINPQIDKSK